MKNVVRTCKVEENMIINVDKYKISYFMPLLSNFNIVYQYIKLNKKY